MRRGNAGDIVPVPATATQNSDDPEGVPFLAAALAEEVVLLDRARGQLVLLDADAARVWRACDPSATVGMPGGRRSAGIMRRLAQVRAIVREGTRWLQVPVRWV